MFISDFAIKRPIVTVVSMLALVVFGLIALASCRRTSFPTLRRRSSPSPSRIRARRRTASRRRSSIPSRKPSRRSAASRTINGTAEDGFATVMVEFLFDKPLTEATQDIRDAISGIRQDLPAEMEEPIIKKFNDTDLPIVSLALSSTTLTPGELTRLADPGITRELRSIRRRRRGGGAGQGRARAHGADQARSAAGCRHRRLAARAGAAAAEPRGAGRAA